MDVYQEITNRIIARLEAGEIPWQRKWCGSDVACNYVTGRVYSLLNQLLLPAPGEYATYKQVNEAGGKVKKGAKGKFVVFWKMIPIKQDPDPDKPQLQLKPGDIEIPARTIPYLQYYQVFNIATDCEGLQLKHEPDVSALHTFNPDERAEQVIAEYTAREGVTLQHVQQGGAYYSPEEDLVMLPLKEQFESSEYYYSTAFHELVHSTGHKSRLNRSNKFNKTDYSKEELVAEIGSAAILHTLGIETDGTFTNAAAYIQSWLKCLRNDKHLIVIAAGKAEKAADLIFGRTQRTQ